MVKKAGCSRHPGRITGWGSRGARRGSTGHEVRAGQRRSKQRWGTLDQVMLDGEASGGTARGDAELAVDRGQVPVDGARADGEPLGDLSIGESLCHETQHLHLAGGQSCWSGPWRCQGRLQRLRGLWRESLARGERLCGCHGAALCQRLFEGWLAQHAANYGYHALLESVRG